MYRLILLLLTFSSFSYSAWQDPWNYCSCDKNWVTDLQETNDPVYQYYNNLYSSSSGCAVNEERVNQYWSTTSAGSNYYWQTLQYTRQKCRDCPEGTEYDGTGACVVPPVVCELPEIKQTDAQGNEYCHNPDDDLDTDKDGIKNSDDTDDDNDRYSDAQESAEGTDKNNPASNGSAAGGGSTSSATNGSPVGTVSEPDGGGSNPGRANNPTCVGNCGQTKPLYGCQDFNSVGSVSTPVATIDYLDCSTCKEITRDFYGETCESLLGTSDLETNSCIHDSVRSGYPFQLITKTADACTNLWSSSSIDGNGAKQLLNNCDVGNTACFYNAGTPTDYDANNTDSNPDDMLDDSAILDKLEEIKHGGELLGYKLNVIDDSINSQTDKLSDSLNAQTTANSDNLNKVNESIGTQTTELGDKLDGIKSAIESKETFPQESELILEYDEAEVDGKLSTFEGTITTEFNSFLDGYKGDMLSLMTISIPTTANCGCTDIPLNLDIAGHSYNEVVEICAPLNSLFDIMRPLLWFSFLVTTLFLFFRKE